MLMEAFDQGEYFNPYLYPSQFKRENTRFNYQFKVRIRSKTLDPGSRPIGTEAYNWDLGLLGPRTLNLNY